MLRVAQPRENRERVSGDFVRRMREEVGAKVAKFDEKGRDVQRNGGEDKKRYEKEMEKYVPMSNTELNKLKAKAEKEKKERSENSGFKKPYKCSEKLNTFLNGQETITRAQLTKQMWAYFKEKNLKDPENKQFVISDDKLFKLIGAAVQSVRVHEVFVQRFDSDVEERENEREKERERDVISSNS